MFLTWNAPACITFFLFFCSNLVDDVQSHQVHTTRTGAWRGCWQSDSQAFQSLLHFSLFKELLGKRATAKHLSCKIFYSYYMSCKVIEILFRR